MKKYLFEKYYGKFSKSFQYRNKIKKLNIEKLKIPREIKLELYFENRSFSKILEFFQSYQIGKNYNIDSRYYNIVFFLKNLKLKKITKIKNSRFNSFVLNKNVLFIGPGDYQRTSQEKKKI